MLYEIWSKVLLAAVLLSICVAIEQIAVIERYPLRARIPGAMMQFSGAALGLILMWPLNRLWRAVDPAMVLPLWQWLQPLGMIGYALQILALIVVADFLAYWRHRMEHSRWWWPVHKVHHAPRELHAANDIGHPLQTFFSFAFISVPMSLIEISGPQVPLAAAMTVTFLSMYIHSPIDFHFGPLRRIVVDNRFHRIHHSLESRHFDKNFGICFSVWDWLFGTAYWPSADEWPEVGVADVPAPRSLKDYLLLPFPKVRRSWDRRRSEPRSRSSPSGTRASTP